ncbi:ricin-type beta-trefoil lectin domain protein [Streptomyces sp. NPDC004266]|uniref:ricin-type beta-trefoil lectin domain protein n=1 Tax=Streptomyces sp. NPDC004266 TaxID=3364693 RepID=UPI003698103E
MVVKPLAGGKRAVTVVNKNATATTYRLDLARVGFGNRTCGRTARDLWKHTNFQVTDSITATIGSHDNAMYTIEPGTCGTATPTGMIQSAQPAFQAQPFCLDANGTSAGAEVSFWDCHGGTNQQWIRHTNGTIASLRTPSLCLSGDTAGLRLAGCDSTDTKQAWT